MTSLIVLRFFCGVFGSSGPALGVATCADVSGVKRTARVSYLTERSFGWRKSEDALSASTPSGLW